MSHLLAFMAVGFLAVAVPGPDFAVVARNALKDRRLGVCTALGISSGLAVHATLAALGLSTILLASSLAFEAVKLAGAAYLILLGVRCLMGVAKRRLGNELMEPIDVAEVSTTGDKCEVSAFHAYRQGLLTNVLNPKVVLFFISFLPQFVPENASVTWWACLFAGTQILIATGWFIFVSIAVAAVRRSLSRPAVSDVMECVTGIVFVGFAAKLLTQSR